MITTARQALGLLAAHALGHMVASEDDGCCTECCAPCAALAWYRDTDRQALEAAVISTMAPGSLPYYWQTGSYGLDWAWAGTVWRKPCLFAADHGTGA